MPKVVTKFKCKECLDVFEATSDVFTECGCKKCCVKPSEYSTTYKGDMAFEQLETKTYRYQEDYHLLSQEFLSIWENIKKIKNGRGYKSPSLWIYERMEKSDDGNSFLASLMAEAYESNNSNETTKLKFNVDLRNKHDDEVLLLKVKRFYDLFMKIENEEINLNDRDAMQKHSSGWDRERCELYDYTFYA